MRHFSADVNKPRPHPPKRPIPDLPTFLSFHFAALQCINSPFFFRRRRGEGAC